MRTKFISPSLLAFADDPLTQLKVCQQLQVEYIHYDVMDHKFVPNCRFMAYEWLDEIHALGLQTFVHLMTVDPLKHVQALCQKTPKPAVIVFHYEVLQVRAISDLLTLLRNYGVQAGLALKPQTPITVLKPFLPLLDWVIILGVEPGFGGQSYLETTTTKLLSLERLLSTSAADVRVCLDGGVNLAVLTQTRDYADCFVSGSFLLQQADFVATYDKLKKIVRMN